VPAASFQLAAAASGPRDRKVARLSFFVHSRRNQESGFRIQDSGFGIQDSGFRIQDSGFRIQDSGFSAWLVTLPGFVGFGFGWIWKAGQVWRRGGGTGVSLRPLTPES
jgi:hypothetical protein